MSRAERRKGRSRRISYYKVPDENDIPQLFHSFGYLHKTPTSVLLRNMSMNTKVITAGIIVIVIIIGIIYFMSKGAAAPVQDTASTTPDQTAAQTTTNASSTGQVQGQDVAIGTGPVATPGSTVSVLYVGKLQDGTVFDSSAAHNNQPLSFTLGTNGLIPGFQIGVNGMKVGGERLLVIPPTLGYGTQEIKDSTGKVIIPANSTLIFDIKLVNVTPGTSTPAQGTAPAAPATTH